jgi:hypothetical protein
VVLRYLANFRYFLTPPDRDGLEAFACRIDPPTPATCDTGPDERRGRVRSPVHQRRPPRAPFPLGATWDGTGVNFALYAEHATAVEVLLFDTAYDPEPSATWSLRERTGPVWHGYLVGVRPGPALRAAGHGPWAPHEGHRFNPNKVLLDPYARAIGRPVPLAPEPAGSSTVPAARCPTSRLRPLRAARRRRRRRLRLAGRRAPRVPWEDMVVYEAHVRGLTMRHPDVPEELRGTFLGPRVAAGRRHLRDLGVTTVSLLPVTPVVDEPRLLDLGLSNYWGYHPLGYFAPEPRYSSNGPLTAVHDFKTMVRELHRAGIEVMIDVVYNHTGEGDHRGPTLSFRGIDNRAYYKLSPKDRRFYLDYTGTGNTLDPGNPYVLQLITDSLRYWVTEMGVDGFRFDLAAALARELHDVDMLSAFFKVIQQDPVLSRVKLVAEPWDVGHGGYQVGNFPWQWLEWNGRYRDAVRAYWRGDPRPGRRARHPPRRLRRPLRPQRPAAVGLGQLRHGPRRLHPRRPRQLRAQAQPRQRRGQPRRPRPRDLQQRRRRGAHRSPRRAPPPARAASRPAGDAAAVAGRADAARRRRAVAQPARQQQRLLPGQRHQLVRLGARRRGEGVPGLHPRDGGLPPRAPGVPAPQLPDGPRPPRTAAATSPGGSATPAP